MLGSQDVSAEKDLYRATPAVTQGIGLSEGGVERTRAKIA
jgi:hypothetical protein